MKLLVMIGKVLRAMRRAAAQWKTVMFEVGGKLVSMLVPSGEPVEPDETEATEAPAVDQFALHVRTLAAQMIADGTPNPDVMAELPEHIVRWLSVCDDQMLRGIARATDQQIQDHVRGRKGLRGCMWSDPESVDAYVRSLLDDPDVSEEEVSLHRAWVPA